MTLVVVKVEVVIKIPQLLFVRGFPGSSGEGNGNPLQHSCLENPMDGGAWWATYSPRGRKELAQLSDFISLHFLAAQLVKNLPAVQELGFESWVGKIPWSRKWKPTPVFVPGESHGQRSLVGYKSIGSQRVRHN